MGKIQEEVLTTSFTSSCRFCKKRNCHHWMTIVEDSLCQDDYDEISCYQREMNKCHDTIPLPSQYPQTPKDLMAVCRILISKRSCSLEATENCDDAPDRPHLRNLPGSLNYLKSTCQEDNPTFKVVASNLPCVERVLKSQDWRHCGNFFSEKNFETILTEIRLLVGEDYKSEEARCLNDLLDVTCQGVIFGYHCGEEMKEAAEEIVAHLHHPNYMECRAEQLEEVSRFLGMFEGLLVEEIELGNNLKKKRK